MKIDFKNKKLWIVAGSVIVAIILVWIIVAASGGGSGGADARLTRQATRGPMVIKVTGSGEVRSKDNHKITLSIRRSANISFLAPEGARVQKDQVIARLNPESLDSRVEDLESSHKRYLNELDTVKTDLEIQQIDNQTSRKTAEQNVQKAQLELDQYLQGEMPLSRRNAELKLQTAKSELDRKEKRHEDLKGLLEEGFVTEDEVEEARIDIETAKVGLETATLQQENLEKYDIPLKKATAENALAKAKTELEKTDKTNKSVLRTKELAVLEAQREVGQVVEDLEDAQSDRKQYEIKAPAEGVLQYGDPDSSWRRNEIRVGASVSRGQVLMTIPGITSLLADININESDIRKIKLGQSAFVTADALSGTPIEGKVISIAEVANAGNFFGSDVKEFSIKIDIGNNPDLKPGFSCQAVIQTMQLDDVIKIPVQALFQNEDQFFVYLYGAPTKERHPVTIGQISITHVEITQGLTEGQRVYLTPPPSEEGL